MAVRVPLAAAEIARGRLLVLAPNGFEEVERGDELELAVYTDDAGEAALTAAFGDVRVTPVRRDWEQQWRAFHRPVTAGGLWIGPPWRSPPPRAVAIRVEPGRAFGTGAHPTTRACIELLAREARTSVLDAGCGSGVVAVAAHLLGFRPVYAADADPAAVEATASNARRNAAAVDVRRLDVLVDPLPPARLVVANIERRVVEALLARRPATRAIVSGYPADTVPSVPGWRVSDALELDGWAAHALVAADTAARSPEF